MITGKMRVECPEKVSVTLTLTATLREWDELHSQLGSLYPSWALSNLIGQALADVRRTVTVEQEYPAP